MEPTSEARSVDDVAERVPEIHEAEIRDRVPEFREPPTYLQRAGLAFAYWTLGALCAFLLVILGYWFLQAPRLSDFANPVTAESLRLYKEASDLAFQRTTTLAGIVAGSTLLPVLTFVLGHAFGSQAASSSSGQGG